MRSKISSRTRQFVSERAGFRCEYCRVHQDDHGLTFPIDHIVSVKHGGDDEEDNLALSCPDCNRNKGADLGSYLEDKTVLIRFFHPRLDNWAEHFRMEQGFLHPLTPSAEVTIRILRINYPDRVAFRQGLMAVSRYP